MHSSFASLISFVPLLGMRVGNSLRKHAHWITHACGLSPDRYVPPSLRGDKTVGRRSQEWRDTVHSAAAKVKAELQRQGTLMVGYQSIPINGDKSPPNFFRMVVISMDSTHGHMDFLLNEIERVGLELNL